MFVRYLATVGAAAALGLTGCASHKITAKPPERSPLGREMPVYEAPSESDSAAVSRPEVHEPEGELDLRETLALALLHNPKLAETSWNMRIMEARVLQSSLRPNPELEVEVEEFAGSGSRRDFEAAEASIRLSQVIELGGKRPARKRLAGMERRLADYDFEAERLAVLTDATIGFIDVLAAQEQLIMAEDLLHLSEEMYDVVTERVRAGKVTPLEETKASIELANRKIELAKIKSNLHVARKRLAATWGSTAPRFIKVTGAIEQVREVPHLEAIEAHIQMNPDVARWAVEMEHRLAELALERARRVFDLTLSMGVQRFTESDDYAFTFGFSLPVPLFDRNQGSVREARYRLAQVEQKTKNAEVRAVTALAESYEALVSAHAEALGLKNEVIPAAGRAFEAARDGYQRGKFGYLEVLDAQRTFSEANARLLDTLARYHRAVAVVESLIGTGLESLPEVEPTQLEE